jgi:hypothetical protein
VPPAFACDPDAMASSLIGRPPLRGQLLAVVVEDRQVAGLVTTDELRLAILHARLRASRPGRAVELAQPGRAVGPQRHAPGSAVAMS